MTLEEIKDIIYPKEKVDMVEVLKELLKLKFNEGELVTFGGIYLYNTGGDFDLYLNGLAIVNDNLICTAYDAIGRYSSDCDYYLGTVGDSFRSNVGILLTDEVIKNVCKQILEDETKKGFKIDFDFKTMKSRDDYYINGEYLEKVISEREDFKNKVEEFCNGTSAGYVKW